MCRGCGKFWTALQVLWSTVYIVCGAAQLIAGIFFMISIPTLQLSSNIWTGSWNIIIGICGGMLACLGRLSHRRQEILLYMSVSVLTVNLVNLVLCEWGLYFADLTQILKNHRNHLLIDYACFATRLAAAIVLLVSFCDSQFAFCSMQGSTDTGHQRKKKPHGSHEQVSDIEYIIPRPKSAKSQHATVYNAYSQSWVFDSESASSSNLNPSAAETPYLKILENGSMVTKCTNGDVATEGDKNILIIDNPVVHVEEASDDSASNSDRKLCHMRSFSRSASPILISPSSSHVSLNHKEGQSQSGGIYDCLETIYRSRINSGTSDKEQSQSNYQSPKKMIMLKRTESVSPNVEKVQYASLMKELQKAIVNKKEAGSPLSNSESTTVSSTSTDKNQNNSNSSDAEFSKELEAALQLIQDLESPNTIETPSTEPKSDNLMKAEESRPLTIWQSRSDSEKTLSAVAELTSSPLTEFSTFKSPPNGKSASVIIRYPESQSTSGYSSPTISNQTTPSSWSTTSSLNGSNNDIIAYSIHNAKSSTVISLYSSQTNQIKPKSVTLVNVNQPAAATTAIPSNLLTADAQKLSSGWTNVKSLLRKNKRQSSLPRLCPELEGAIVKSESLAYLSELELLARHQRNTEIQREIEERVIQQLGTTPRTESSC